MLESARVLAAAAVLAASVALPVEAEAAPAAVTYVAAVTHGSSLAPTLTAKKYKNCTALNKAYKHGVAKKKGVKDKTSGKRVTTYTVNLRVYNLNKGLDRDKDGIACEKR